MGNYLFRFQYLLAIVGMLLLIGCTSPEVTLTATIGPSLDPDTPPPTVTHTPEPDPTATDQPQSTDAPTIAPSSMPDVPLSAEGPWFVFEASREDQPVDDLWAINLDDTGLTRLPINRLNRYSLHPTESIIAYVAGDLFSDRVLMLLYLPSGDTETITPLTSEITAYPLTPPPDEPGVLYYLEIARALSDNRPSWSPDGRSLAFVGAMNGTSADIYVYSLDTGMITQITSGPTQVLGLIWSSDGKYILHLGINGFGTGVGHDVDSIWVSRSDGSGSTRLADYPNGQNPGASVFGWMSNDVVLVSDYSVGANDNNLRLINITTGEVQPIWEYFYTNFAVDWESGAVMISPLEVYDLEVEKGVWLYRPGISLQQVSERHSDFYVHWLPDAGVFYIKAGTGIQVVDPQGNSTSVPLRGLDLWFIIEAPGGQTWAWYGPDGLCIGSHSQTPECVFDEQVWWVLWLPDGTGLMVATEEAIYLTPYPDIDFKLIVSDMDIGLYRVFVPNN